MIQRANRIKRGTFPWATMGMLCVVGLIDLGAAADPATGLPHTQDWVTPHLIGALLGMAFIAYTFFVEWQNIDANHSLIGEILKLVRQVRQERGLEV